MKRLLIAATVWVALYVSTAAQTSSQQESKTIPGLDSAQSAEVHAFADWMKLLTDKQQAVGRYQFYFVPEKWIETLGPFMIFDTQTGTLFVFAPKNKQWVSISPVSDLWKQEYYKLKGIQQK